MTSFASDQERFHPSGPALREKGIISDRRHSQGSDAHRSHASSVNKRRQTSQNSSRFLALFRYLGLRGEAYVNTSTIPEIPKTSSHPQSFTDTNFNGSSRQIVPSVSLGIWLRSTRPTDEKNFWEKLHHALWTWTSPSHDQGSELVQGSKAKQNFHRKNETRNEVLNRSAYFIYPLTVFLLLFCSLFWFGSRTIMNSSRTAHANVTLMHPAWVKGPRLAVKSSESLALASGSLEFFRGCHSVL